MSRIYLYYKPNIKYFRHYQKIDKYKRKYRGNYRGKKKLKQSKKKNDDVSFLPMDLPSVNLLVNCEHCSSC